MTGDGDLVFVDTNVLLYVFDMSNVRKHEMARAWVDALWANSAGVVSWQVLNECYVNAVRKLRAPVKTVRAAIENYSTWRVADLGIASVRRAWHWADLADVPYWDALVIAAAETTGCGYLLSEDFQEGQRFGRIEVVSPFRSDAATLFARR